MLIALYTIQERLVSLAKYEASTGEALVQLVSKVMLGLNFDLKNCVGTQLMVQQTCRGATKLQYSAIYQR